MSGVSIFQSRLTRDHVVDKLRFGFPEKSMQYWFDSYPFNGAFRKPFFQLTNNEYDGLLYEVATSRDQMLTLYVCSF